MSIINIDWNILGGSHITYKGIYQTILDSINMGMYSTQFFLGNPYSLNRAKIQQEEIFKTQQLINRFDLRCFSHFPYVSNLCGCKKSLCWNGNKETDDKLRNVIDSLTYEIGILSKLGGAVVIHPGSFGDRKLGIQAIKKSIEKINFPEDGKLLLENSAGQGDTLATTLYEIKEMLEVKNNQYLGVCIDTAHLWGVGEYDISQIEGVEKFFIDFDKIIGLEKLELIHLNDSCVEFGSRKDRHENIGKGKIWSRNLDSLRYLLDKIRKLKIPFVLETTPDDYMLVYKIDKKSK
jgi:deoxyribonuclease-4